MKKIVGTFTIKEVANKIKIGEKTLFKIMRELKILNDKNMPFDRFIGEGFLRKQDGSYIVPGTQISKPYSRTLVTEKGNNWLQRVIKEHVATTSKKPSRRQHSAPPL